MDGNVEKVGFAPEIKIKKNTIWLQASHVKKKYEYS